MFCHEQYFRALATRIAGRLLIENKFLTSRAKKQYRPCMACLPATLRTHYQNRLDKYAARLILAETYLDFLMGTEGVESFKFDSGEAASMAKYTNPSTFLNDVIRPLEAQIDHYRNRLNCTGIVRHNLRRR